MAFDAKQLYFSQQPEFSCFSRHTPEQRADDLEDSFNWMQNKGKDADAPDQTGYFRTSKGNKYDPTGEFRKLDGKKKGQSPEDHAHDIEGGWHLMRNNGISPNNKNLVAFLGTQI